MMVQSAEPLYSLFLWREKRVTVRVEVEGHMHLMITATTVNVHVWILLPLDTQCQHNTIMTLKGFLTLVGGAGVPHLRKKSQER